MGNIENKGNRRGAKKETTDEEMDSILSRLRENLDFMKSVEEKLGTTNTIVVRELGDGNNPGRMQEVIQAMRNKQDEDSKTIKEIHDKLFKNGLSAQVATLTSWKKRIDGIVATLIAAFLIATGSYFFKVIVDVKVTEERLKKLDELIEKIEKLDKGQNESQGNNTENDPDPKTRDEEPGSERIAGNLPARQISVSTSGNTKETGPHDPVPH